VACDEGPIGDELDVPHAAAEIELLDVTARVRPGARGAAETRRLEQRALGLRPIADASIKAARGERTEGGLDQPFDAEDGEGEAAQRALVHARGVYGYVYEEPELPRLALLREAHGARR